MIKIITIMLAQKGNAADGEDPIKLLEAKIDNLA
jgi:hypothetical protein